MAMYVGKMKELPNDSIINEFDDLRYVDLCQSIHHADAVIKELRGYGNELLKICYRALNHLSADADVKMEVVTAWEKEQTDNARISASDRKTCEPKVKDYLLKELKTHWDESASSPKNNANAAALSKLLQSNTFQQLPLQLKSTIDEEGTHELKLENPFFLNMFGTPENGQGKVKITYHVERLERATRAMAASLANAHVTKTDGFRMEDIAKPGDVFFIDPPYLQTRIDSKHNKGVRYGHQKKDAYDLTHWKAILGDLEKVWEKGAHIVMTNRWDPDFTRLLVSRGWRVSPPLKTWNIWEVVITNFDWEGGTGAIRRRRAVNPYKLLADANQGTQQEVQCEYVENGKIVSEKKAGVVIDNYFYTESAGYLTRFEPQSTGRRSSRLTRIIPDASTVWELSANQKDLPEILDHNSWSAPDVDAKTQKRLSQPEKPRNQAPTLKRLRSRSRVSGLANEPAAGPSGLSRGEKSLRSEEAGTQTPAKRPYLPRQAKSAVLNK